MASQVTYGGHLLVFALSAWGHLKPLCTFSAKVVKERHDVAITFLMVGDRRKQVEGEISKYFSDKKIDFGATGNIRIVNICDDQNPNIWAMFPMMIKAFPGYYDNLLNAKPVQCLETKTTFHAILKPNTIILDFFFLETLQQIRTVTGKSIPVFAWATTNTSSILRFMGPEKKGGFGDVATKARVLVEATGRQLEEVIHELYHPLGEDVIRVPGMPPMYDYEWRSQELSPEIPLDQLFNAAYIFSRECDGFISVSSPAYESESLDALRRWIAETNRPVYAIGPLVPPDFGDAAGLSSVAKQKEIDSPNDGEFQIFLDKTLKSHGEHSLIYVSFGSVWWPKRNEHVWMLVDMLLELNFPFILSHPSHNAVVPSGYAEKIKESRIGLLSTWCPQQAILNHPVTGWFLTHCGQNSVTEALAQGIPMIAWPLDGDQPANAAHLTLNLDVAFEMVEVRTGPGLKPLHRGAQPTGTIEAVTAEARSVLERARGPEGARKRRNVEAMRDNLKKEWEEGGEAMNNLRKFCTDNFSGN